MNSPDVEGSMKTYWCPVFFEILFNICAPKTGIPPPPPFWAVSNTNLRSGVYLLTLGKTWGNKQIPKVRFRGVLERSAAFSRTPKCRPYLRSGASGASALRLDGRFGHHLFCRAQMGRLQRPFGPELVLGTPNVHLRLVNYP